MIPLPKCRMIRHNSRENLVAREHRHVLKKPLFSPIGCFLSALACVALGTLVRFRALPFLRDDTILAGGKLVSTDQWAAFMSRFFYFGSAAMVTVGLIALLASPRR
jgi:hypothetical protein